MSNVQKAVNDYYLSYELIKDLKLFMWNEILIVLINNLMEYQN